MPSTPFSSFKRRVAAFFNSSSKSYAGSGVKQQQRQATTTQSTNVNTTNNKSSSDVLTNHPSPKSSKMRLKNLRLPWTKKKRSNKSSLDIAASFRDFPQPEITQGTDTNGSTPAGSIHRPHYHHRRTLSCRGFGITVDTDNHSLMDEQSTLSIPCTPPSPIFRYRMHYGPSIENIENMGEVFQAESHSPQDEYIQKLDKEMAQVSIRVMKKRQRKQLRLRLSIDGARPGESGCGSTVSSTPSTPVSVIRCKTSRGTYNPSSSGLPSPATPSSARSFFLRCKTARGTYDSAGLPSSPATPTSTRSFLSSMSLKSPIFQQRFSSRVAPSPSASASPSCHASLKPPPPLSRLTSFADLKDNQGPFLLTKEHIEYICRMENRLRILENSAPCLISLECDQKLQQKQLQPPQQSKQQQQQQQQQQFTFTDSTPNSENTPPHDQQQQQQQQVRTKQTMIRKVDAGYIDPRTSRMQKRMSMSVDRTACQSSTRFFHAAVVPPRPYSFHDWASKWDYPAAGAIDLSSRRGSSPLPSAAALVATARSSRRNDRHVLCIEGDDNQTTDRTELLLEQAKERVASRMRLETSLWETDTLMRQYETLVVQDWGLKFGSLCVDQQEKEQEQQKQAQILISDSGSVARNPQEIPCDVN